jgi:acetyl-CoA acetyltransferase
MQFNAVIAGVGMTHFGKHMDTGLKALGAEAVKSALADAGIEQDALQAAYVGNAAAGLVTGQESIRGQVILRSIGLGRIPVVNVENACASASTALHQACAMVTGGLYDLVLALGVEKLYHPDKKKSFGAFSGAVDVEAMQAIMEGLRKNAEAGGAKSASSGAGEKRSMFMDIYAAMARGHMEKYGTPMIAEPLTRPMCSPIGDGAAAAVVVSEKKARELGIDRPVRVVTSVLHSGWDHGIEEMGTVELCAREAFEEAGVGPEDLDVVECHDASAPAEVSAYESMGLCPKGEGGKLIDEGTTRLGGRVPVNTSGGLLRKGHPVGATGIAQIVELTEQLQGRSGERQVEGAKVALAHNGGGTIGTDAAAMCVTILMT